MASIPDLHSQLESLLHAVREAEKAWNWNDQLDLAQGVLPRPRHGPVDGPAWVPPKDVPPWSPGSPKT
jgi:hypothetical protein